MAAAELEIRDQPSWGVWGAVGASSLGAAETLYFHLLTSPFAGQTRLIGDLVAWGGRRGRQLGSVGGLLRRRLGARMSRDLRGGSAPLPTLGHAEVEPAGGDDQADALGAALQRAARQAQKRRVYRLKVALRSPSKGGGPQSGGFLAFSQKVASNYE